MAAKLVLENQFGEVSDNYVLADESLQPFSDALPAKTGVTAISALATANAATQTASYVQADVQSIATLANALKTQVNAILAALKVVS